MNATATSRAPRVRPPLEGASTEARTYDVALLRRLLPYGRPHLAPFVVAFLLVPVTALVGLLQPLLKRAAIQAALVQQSESELRQVAMWFGAAVLVDFVARFAQMFALQLAGQRTIADLRAATYAKVQRLPLSYLDRTAVGRVVTRVTNDSDAMGELFASGAVLAVADLLTLGGIVAVMLWLDARLTLIVCCALPPLGFIVNRIRSRMRDAYREIRATVAQLNAFVGEQVQGISIVQAFGREAECAA